MLAASDVRREKLTYPEAEGELVDPTRIEAPERGDKTATAAAPTGARVGLLTGERIYSSCVRRNHAGQHADVQGADHDSEGGPGASGGTGRRPDRVPVR